MKDCKYGWMKPRAVDIGKARSGRVSLQTDERWSIKQTTVVDESQLSPGALHKHSFVIPVNVESQKLTDLSPVFGPVA